MRLVPQFRRDDQRRPRHFNARTQAWFKEDSSVTLSGSSITTMTESSGNAYTYSQGTSGRRPTVQSAILNGMRVYRFDGSDDVLTGPTSGSAITLLNGKSEAWIVAVYKSASTNDAFRYVGLLTSDDGGTGGNAYIALQASGGGASFVNVPCAAGRSNVSDAYQTKYSATSVSTNWTIAMVRIRSLGRTGIVNVNGSPDESAVLSGMTDNVFDSGAKRAFTFGNTFAASSSFSGDVAELAFGTGKLSEFEVDAWFGYLANKWGLTANLPALHPYKNSAPNTSFLAGLV